jgi:hypothetical protein
MGRLAPRLTLSGFRTVSPRISNLVIDSYLERLEDESFSGRRIDAPKAQNCTIDSRGQKCERDCVSIENQHQDGRSASGARDDASGRPRCGRSGALRNADGVRAAGRAARGIAKGVGKVFLPAYSGFT